MRAQDLRDATLFVADIDSSAAFYRAIGCDVLEYDLTGYTRHFDVVMQDAIIQLFPASERHRRSHIQLGIRVAQIEDAGRGLDEIGAHWTSPGPKRLSAADPDGNAVHITEIH